MVSAEGNGGAVSVAVSAPAEQAPSDRPNYWAIAVAALAHLAVIAWLLFDWNSLAAPALPESIPIQLVMEAPKPKPAPPPPVESPAPKPQPPPDPALRTSGKDLHTTAPPAAETAGPEEAPPPAPLPSSAPPEKPAPSPAPALPPSPAAVPVDKTPRNPARNAPRPVAQAQALRAPRVAPHTPENRARGAREEAGDPLVNAMYQKILSYRPAKLPVGPLGLSLEGTVGYWIVFAKSGEIVTITLTKSSGSQELDTAALQMIKKAEPFPQLPPNYPEYTGFSLTIPFGNER